MTPLPPAASTTRTFHGERKRRAALARLRGGESVEAVAAALGVPSRTVRRWRHKAGMALSIEERRRRGDAVLAARVEHGRTWPEIAEAFGYESADSAYTAARLSALRQGRAWPLLPPPHAQSHLRSRRLLARAA